MAEEYLNEDDVQLEYTKRSFVLSLWKTNSSSNEEGAGGVLSQRLCDKRLAFSKLFGPIESASFKKKKDKIILILVKADDVEWSSIGAK